MTITRHPGPTTKIGTLVKVIKCCDGVPNSLLNRVLPICETDTADNWFRVRVPKDGSDYSESIFWSRAVNLVLVDSALERLKILIKSMDEQI